MRSAHGGAPLQLGNNVLRNHSHALTLDRLGVDELANAEVGALAALAGVLDADDRHGHGGYQAPGRSRIMPPISSFAPLGLRMDHVAARAVHERRLEGLAHRPHDDQALAGEAARRAAMSTSSTR
jgi:hypothetical protein